jgi:hypothetical protein
MSSRSGVALPKLDVSGRSQRRHHIADATEGPGPFAEKRKPPLGRPVTP